MSAAAEAEEAGVAGEGLFPRFRALHLKTLDEHLDSPPPLADEALQKADWSALIAHVRSDPANASLLLRIVAWGLSDGDLLWWSCLAARFEETLSGRRPSAALVMAERWLREGDESLRYQTFDRAQAETKATAGTLAGYAVFAAGPSLAPQDADPSPPTPGMARSAALGALLCAAAAPAMAATSSGFDVVNLIGLEIAAGHDGRAAARRALNAVEPWRLESAS